MLLWHCRMKTLFFIQCLNKTMGNPLFLKLTYFLEHKYALYNSADVSSKQEKHSWRFNAIQLTSTSKCIFAFWSGPEAGRKAASWWRSKWLDCCSWLVLFSLYCTCCRCCWWWWGRRRRRRPWFCKFTAPWHQLSDTCAECRLPSRLVCGSCWQCEITFICHLLYGHTCQSLQGPAFAIWYTMVMVIQWWCVCVCVCVEAQRCVDADKSCVWDLCLWRTGTI